MAVEYRHYLVPVDRTFVPDAAVVERLIDALRTNGYVLATEALVSAQDDELALVFRVAAQGGFEKLGLRSPFAGAGANEAGGYDLILHRARDFVHHMSEDIAPVDTCCACGEELGYEPSAGGESHIRAQCTHCGRPFVPAGGLAYRFAVILDCGRSIPGRGDIALAPAFAQLLTSVLGQPLDDVGDYG